DFLRERLRLTLLLRRHRVVLLEERRQSHVPARASGRTGRGFTLFRTFKEAQRFYAPVLVSLAHLEAVCRDFSVFYNHCRPHSSFEGRTPAEVDRGLAHQPVLGRAVLFDGQLYAYRFT
ncbi:MAG: integrase core domain-containing protein, partial [Armatimonadota bacterium]